MNSFINNKKTKKFIIALVVLVLFSFCYPKNVKAGNFLQDLPAGMAKLVWTIEKGIIKFLNNIFTSDHYNTIESTGDQVLGKDDEPYDITTMEVFLTPENIIKGRFVLFDANIFREVKNDGFYYDLEIDPSTGNIIGKIGEGRIALRKVIAGWYYSLRNFGVVALLSVLVYVGIRMIMSTVAQDKAKYKIMFKDWLVALCILILMHYIMVAILNVSSLVLESFGSSGSTDLMGNLITDITATLSEQSKDNGWIYYTADGAEMEVSDAFAKLLVLGGVILYTFIFAIKYLKREFTIIFLILLGPISCITYPIDKISDGKAQAFNKWFSEFLYQVIIQPFHLLLYIVLVGSAAELAEANVIYALICFAILIPSEKFIKEMFGFKDKLGSPLGAFAGGALAAKAMGALMKSGGGSGGGGNVDKNKDSESEPALPPKTVNKNEMLGTDNEDSQQHISEGNGPDGNEDADSEGDGENAQVSQGENPELEGTTDGEALAAGMGAAAATEAANNDEETGKDVDEQAKADQAYETQRAIENGQVDAIDSKKQSRFGRFAALRQQRISRRLGVTKGQRLKRQLGKGAKGAAVGALKTAKFAAATGIGLTAATAALMTGNGKAAAAALGLVGANTAKTGFSLGKKVITGAAGFAGGVGKDWIKSGRTLEKQESKALKAFMSDPAEINKAITSYKANHDNAEPSREELETEMSDRFELSRYGIDESQMNKVLKVYQGDRSKKIEEAGKGADLEKVQKNVLLETVYASKLAKDYSKKDFRTGETMGDAVVTIAADFQTKGVKDPAVARQRAKEYLTIAARISGTEMAEPIIEKPKATETKTVIAQEQNDAELEAASRALGLNPAVLKKEQKTRILHVTYQLRSRGVTGDAATGVASGCKGGSVTEVLKKYEGSAKYLSNTNAIKAAKGSLGDGATETEVTVEMLRRLTIKQQGFKSISEMRKVERHENKPIMKIAEEFANNNRGYFEDESHMKVAKEELVKQLKAGGASARFALDRAEEIIEIAKKL